MNHSSSTSAPDAHTQPHEPNISTENIALTLLRSYIGREADEFTSPVVRWLNIVLREVAVGAVTLDVLVRPDMCNPIGVLHGGIQCTIMDEAIGIAVAALGSDFFHVNTNLSVDFLDKASAGETIIAKAHVVRSGKNLVNVQCELTHLNERLIARSTSNMFRTEHPSFAKRFASAHLQKQSAS
jgi:acyl-coenzyme A thioesterase 13